MTDTLNDGAITILGDLLLDQYITGDVTRISPEAPVPVLLSSHQRSTPGGAANVAVNVAALGHPVHLIGVVGRYRYTILNRPARPAMQEGFVWHIRAPLDIEAMQEGANHLLGGHDFTSFRAAACQARDALRTLDELTITRSGEYVYVDVQARSFLHHQVRNMVGTLALVGHHQWHPDRVKDALEARDRCKAGPTAPPDGLCLMDVGYPDDPFRS